MYAQCIILVSIFISRTIQEVTGNYGKAGNPVGLGVVNVSPKHIGNNKTTHNNTDEKKILRNAYDATQYNNENIRKGNNPNQNDNQNNNSNEPDQYDNQNDNGNDPNQYDNQNNNENDPDQYNNQNDNGNDPNQYDNQNDNENNSDQYDDSQNDNGNDPNQNDSQNDTGNDPDQYDNQNDNGNDPDQYYNENDPDQYDNQNNNGNDPDQYENQNDNENDPDQYDNHNSNENYPDDSYSDTDEMDVPQSDEMQKNTEQGFDFSQNEMLKLKLWPDGFIPYYIDVYSFNDKVMRDKIRSFLSSVNSLTALNFVEIPVPPSDNSRWVFFVNRRGLLGCADHSIRNFTNEGVQQVILGYHCMSNEGELAEAVLSIAGVPAQHNAPDRDYYITIIEENIIPEKKYLFEKHFDNEWLFHDLEYDFNSAGHFHSYKHSVNGRATMIPQRKLGPVTLGEATALSATDIKKLRMLYNYIAKKTLFVGPDCAKLFEPGNKFDTYKPETFNQAPRPKPYKYVEESVDAPLDSQDIDMVPGQHSSSDKPDIFTDSTMKDIQNIIVPNEYQTPNDVQHPIIVENQNDETYNPVEDVPTDGNNDFDAQNNQISQDESENLTPYQSDDSTIQGKTPPIIHLEPNTKSTIVKLHGIKGKKNRDSPDPLTAWSDFHTDEEINERKNTFPNLLHGKTDLKFKAGR